MKVLIVDDQVVSRMKVQKIMEGFCQADAVDCGQAAIKAFKQSLETNAPYSLITLDVSMPDMDGRQVLQTIRNLESENEIPAKRQVKILMLTSSSDKDTVISSIQAGCDDYLVKPLNRETISGKLEKFGLVLPKANPAEATVRQMIDTAIQRFKKGELDLPVMPHIVSEIQQFMNNSAASVYAVAAIIEKDVAIAAKLIATANSAHYRGVEKIASVNAAISRLGLKEIQDIVATIANKSLYDSRNRQLKQLLYQLWLHSLACAHTARKLSERVVPDHAEKAFMGGLIHDIGSVLLLKSLGDIVSPEYSFDTIDLINSVYEVHTNFGAILLERWAFEECFVRSCQLHEWTSFDSDAEKLVLIVNLADHLAHSMDYGFFTKPSTDLAQLDSSKLLKIDTGIIESVREEVFKMMADLAKTF